MTKKETQSLGKTIKSIVSASSGNLVEWFDFYTYAFMAIYFAPSFFPKGDETAQLLQSAGVFALGFLMRPVGSYIFGKIADKKGRKTSLVTAVCMMCFGSFMIALIPSYETIGIWAPILLLLARMIQGVSVGGEYGTTATYMSEVATDKTRGFFSSFQAVTLVGGQLLAVLTLAGLQHVYSADELKAWAWRIPFFIGGLSALVALYLRKGLHETVDETNTKHKDAGSLKAIWRDHKRSFLIVMGYTAAGSLSFYTFTTYMQKYLINTAGIDKVTVSSIMTGTLVIFMLALPLMGALSDKIGRKNTMLLFTTLGIASFSTLLTRLGTADPSSAFWLVTGALLILALYSSVAAIVKAEAFPPEVRAMGVGFPYAIANAIFGGSAEYVALQFKANGYESGYFMYVTVVCGVALIATIAMPKTPAYLNK